MTMTAGRLDVSTESEGSARPSPLELLPWCIAGAYGLLGLLPLGDPDVWWHLRTGELVVNDGFTRTDPWSWTSTEPWLLHEWGSEVLMYLSYRLGGYHGVIVLRGLMLALIAWLILRSCRRVAGPAITSLVGVVALAAVYPSAGERPQLASFALLAVLLPRLRQAVVDRRPPWELIPITWVWANLHLFWSVGLVLFGAMVAGLALDLGLHRWRVTGRFIAVGALSVGAAALTPNGPRLVLIPLQVGNAPEFITEFAPPTLHDPFTVLAVSLVIAVVVGWARSQTQVSASEITFILTATYIGLSYQRTVAVLAIAVAPLAAQRLAGLTGPVPRPAPMDRAARD